jgi:outer membrane lipoprotein-sorting protein
MRLLLLFWLSVAALLADGPFGFSEKRYVYSIDKTLTFTGVISFNGEGMQIDYDAPEKKRIVYNGDRLQIFNASLELQHEVDLATQPAMKLYMQFMLWLYRGEFEALENYFTLSERNEELHLEPIAPTDKVVKSVKVLQEDGKPRFIKTSMSNNDEIAINIAR